CSDDGTPTGAATLMGSTKPVKSTYSKPFTAKDGTGTTVLGWKVVFTGANAGTGCKAEGVKSLAAVFVYTSQASGSSPKVADLATGGVSIVLDAPPTPPAGGQSANMEADSVTNIQGLISISGVAKSGDGKTIIGLEGTVSAGGMDANNANVILSGMF